MNCKGQCDNKFYANKDMDGYCSMCYILNKTGETKEEYTHRLALPLENAVGALACSDIQYKLFNDKLNSLYAWNMPLITVYLNIIKKELFFTAKQAENILKNKHMWKLQHIICSRVIDTWNMTDRHGVGECYYKDNNLKPKNTDFSDLKCPSGKIFQPEDIFNPNNLKFYHFIYNSMNNM
jgi:hypothetical protein